MIAAFVAAFKDTIDFCDWEETRIADSARDNVIGFFSGERGEPHPASRLRWSRIRKSSRSQSLVLPS